MDEITVAPPMLSQSSYHESCVVRCARVLTRSIQPLVAQYQCQSCPRGIHVWGMSNQAPSMDLHISRCARVHKRKKQEEKALQERCAVLKQPPNKEECRREDSVRIARELLILAPPSSECRTPDSSK